MPSKLSKGEYIETDTGNKISRRAHIHGLQNIILGGRTVIQGDTVIRADLVRAQPPPVAHVSASAPHPVPSTPANTIAIAIGRYSFISSGATLRPPSRLHRGVVNYHPLKIGDFVFIGAGCVIEAASIGSNVWIGAGAVVGKMAILKDKVRVLRGACVPPGMVVASGYIVGGKPARAVGEIGYGDDYDEVERKEAWRETKG